MEARIDSAVFDANPGMREQLHQSLNDRFVGVQLLTHKPFELSEPSMCRLHPDGRRDVTLFVHSLTTTTSIGTVDIVVKDKHGNVINDCGQARIEKKRHLAELIERHRCHDALLDAMATSYQAAVLDPANELVHLYEVRDAVTKQFGGEQSARKALAVSASEWSRLGQLANSEPLKQGRHRGRTIGVLRDSTEAELTRARGIARQIIEGYLGYLESRSERQRDS